MSSFYPLLAAAALNPIFPIAGLVAQAVIEAEQAQQQAAQAAPAPTTSVPPAAEQVAPQAPEYKCDVLIAGSGPVAATYARAFYNSGLNVIMVEVGDLDTVNPGTHKKNTVGYQKDIDKFVNVIQGALSKVSIPASSVTVNTLDPGVWTPDKPFTHNGINPLQNPSVNLGAQAVTKTVGGMSTHWTCATPRFTGEELPILAEGITAEENQKLWDALYEKAEGLLGTSSKEFDISMRQQMVMKALKDAYGDSREFKPLPLACDRITETFVRWHSAGSIFDLRSRRSAKGSFKLLPNHQCWKLNTSQSQGGTVIDSATIRDFRPETAPLRKPDTNEPLSNRPLFNIKADVYILACGAVANPQILVNSDIANAGHPTAEQPEHFVKNVGRYITEQTMAFCQTVFYRTIIEDAEANPDFKERIKRHREQHPTDPLPIPWTDPEPQLMSVYDDTPADGGHKAKRPWHGQIHRDAFSYGAVAEAIDSRLIVDFRWFGRTEPVKENVIWYSKEHTDLYGMPQPTFQYSVAGLERTRKEANRMMHDMINVAGTIGGFLPGSLPQFLEPGLALHLGGTHRSGTTPDESVTDTESKVWKYKNLYLGGVGNIPTAFARNPTLTAVGYAIRSAEAIMKSHFPNHELHWHPNEVTQGEVLDRDEAAHF